MTSTMRKKLAALSYPEKLQRVADLIAFSHQFKAIAAEQQISEEEALAKGLAEKSAEFHANGAELYARA